MCLLIHQPKGCTFSKSEIADFCDYNADGFGFMYGDGKLLHHLKMVGSAKDVSDTYYKYVAGREAVLHFRMATHGTKGRENAHPFEIVSGIMLAHNGILSMGNPVHAHKTDTEHLVEYFIRPVAIHNPDLLFDPAWVEMLGTLIGASNKLAIAHADGRIALVNEKGGVRHKRAWMSNTYAWTNAQNTRLVDPWTGSYESYRGHVGLSPKDRSAGGVLAGTADNANDPEGDEWDYLDSAYMVSKYCGSVETAILSLTAWTRAYPARACVILLAWYNYTEEEVDELVEESPAEAAEIIHGILTETGFLTPEGNDAAPDEEAIA